jgi:hypothetical protein
MDERQSSSFYQSFNFWDRQFNRLAMTFWRQRLHVEFGGTCYWIFSLTEIDMALSIPSTGSIWANLPLQRQENKIKILLVQFPNN